MTTLVLGASGATGKQLVAQLLEMDQKVRVLVRPAGNIPDSWMNNDRISIIKASISEISVDEMADYMVDCQSAASCLGHNLTLRGIYGKPGKLVADAVKLICLAVQKNSPEKPVRLVLMNTTANRNRDLKESVSMGEKLVMGLIRLLLPRKETTKKLQNICE